MKYRNAFLKGLIILLSTWLVACSGSSGDDGDDGADDGGTGSSGAVISLRDLDGSWTSGCIDTGIESIIALLVFNNGAITGTVSTYATLDCTGAFTQEITNLTMVLGGVVTLDGSVAGITSATEADITDAATPGDVEYDIVAIQGNKLYAGESDAINDGSTPALRYKQLDGFFVLTRV